MPVYREVELLPFATANVTWRNRRLATLWKAVKPAVWTAPLLRVHFEHLAPCPEDEAHSLSVPDGLLLVYGFGSHLEGWLTDRTSDATTRRLWYKIGTIILAALVLESSLHFQLPLPLGRKGIWALRAASVWWRS